MKKENIIFIVVVAILIVGLLVVASILPKGKGGDFVEDLKGINYDSGNVVSINGYKTDNPLVAMRIENYGTIVIELYPDVAPNTVNNFISLVKSGFYDNNNFHRLMPGFVLQGGDPYGTGTGGPGYTIKGEFTNNGFTNNLKHTKGVVSMARNSVSMDSAGSQFFIMLGDSDFLDGDYAAFGKVIDGMDAVEEIARKEKVEDSQSGKLAKNITILKAVVDLNGKEYPEVEKMAE